MSAFDPSKRDRAVEPAFSRVTCISAGRAALLLQDSGASPELIEALQTAAGQASLLGELAESQGTVLTEPQLGRLLEEALANGVEDAASKPGLAEKPIVMAGQPTAGIAP